MNTYKILSIVSLALLGVCLLCGLAKMVMKNDKAKSRCDQVCGMMVFIAVIILGISQILKENKPLISSQ